MLGTLKERFGIIGDLFYPTVSSQLFAAFFLCLTQVNDLCAQHEITFEVNIGQDSEPEEGHDILQVGDKFVAVGYSYYSTGNQNNIYFLFTDSCGNKICSQLIGGSTISQHEHGYAMERNASGHYLLAGDTKNYGPGMQDAYFVGLQENLDTTCIDSILATRAPGWNDGKEIAFDLMIDHNSRIVMAGCDLVDNTTRFNDFYSPRLNSNGTFNAARTYGGNAHEVAYSIKLIQDNSGNNRYLLTGFTQNNPWSAGTDLNMYTLRIDPSNGSIVGTNRVWGDRYFQEAYDAVQLANKDVIFTGYTEYDGGNGDRDIFLVRIDQSGSIIWQYRYGVSGSHDDEVGLAIILDGEMVVVTGYTQATSMSASDEDVFLFRVDTFDGDMTDGGYLWYGGDRVDHGHAIRTTSLNGSGYVIAGFYTEGTSNKNVYIIKTDEFGESGCENLLEIDQTELDWDSANYGNALTREDDDNGHDEHAITDDENGVCDCDPTGRLP